jgi:hypothetical protein
MEVYLGTEKYISDGHNLVTSGTSGSLPGSRWFESIRPLLSLKWLSIDKAEGKVCYQYGKDSSKLERMDSP